MKPVIKSMLLGSALLCLSALSQAQPGPGGPGGPEGMRANMQEHMRQHVTDLKAKLKLTPQQEGAWTSYMAAMKPPADMKRPDRAEIEKLSTPERLDKRREIRKQLDAEMDRRDDATRTFYAQLSAEQKTAFDANTGRAHMRRSAAEPRKP